MGEVNTREPCVCGWMNVESGVERREAPEFVKNGDKIDVGIFFNTLRTTRVKLAF